MKGKRFMAKEIKKRNWAMVIYPESLPTEWKQILIDTGLPIAISPLHDKDLNESTGESKKAHYHVILCYPGPTTFNCVKSVCDSLNAPIPKAIESVKGAYRYFTHLDNPEKYQYSDTEIITLNGFNILDFTELTKTEAEKLRREILSIISENDLLEYSDLIDFLLADGYAEMFDYASNHTIFFNSYLSSRRFKAENRLKLEQNALKSASEYLTKRLADYESAGGIKFDSVDELIKFAEKNNKK